MTSKPTGGGLAARPVHQTQGASGAIWSGIRRKCRTIFIKITLADGTITIMAKIPKWARHQDDAADAGFAEELELWIGKSVKIEQTDFDDTKYAAQPVGGSLRLL